jgi:hypothetical protein
MNMITRREREREREKDSKRMKQPGGRVKIMYKNCN